MRKKICAGNWKMYKSPKEAQTFLADLLAKLGYEKADKFLETVVFPSTVALDAASTLLKGSNLVKWGSQNCHFESSGAFTGETSPQVLSEMGAQYALVGHSERRSLFHENDELLAKKLASIINYKMIPMLCVGETLHERENQLTESVLKRQLEIGLSQMPENTKVVIAYEPVWAIGTGKVATPAMANETHKYVRSELALIAGKDFADSTSILYGGSVKPDNALDLAKMSDIDGFLIGGASLKVDDFIAIRNSLNKL
jgi:triosephosphate isomerase (TIM)